MSESTKRGVRFTILGVLVFMTVVVASFIHRIGEPRIMSVAVTSFPARSWKHRPLFKR